MGASRTYRYGIYDGDKLDCECWCRWKVMAVPVKVIAEGRTLSCGKRDCNSEHPAAQPRPRCSTP